MEEGELRFRETGEEGVEEKGSSEWRGLSRVRWRCADGLDT